MFSRLLLFLPIIFVFSSKLFAQCEVTASVSPTTIVCGDYATLTAFGQGQGQQVFNENFNSGSPTGWAFTQQATFTNPCSPAGVDGTTHIWMGNQSAVPRSLVTQPYNFTTATSGATICFDMLFAEQGDAAPCEGPDEPDEGVFLQYSIDGGNTWVTINYFDPNGGNDPDLVNWNNWCFQIPTAALGPNTQIRFFQDADSGADYDHWGIDNVEIYYNDPTYNITWTHDNYSYGQGSSGGASPNLVNPSTTTDYYVVMTNGSSTCRDTVTLTVVNPTIEINAGNDTTICAGTCANLNATAKVIKKPAKTPTYENNEFEAVNSAFGSTTSININVTDLNMTSVLPGSITEVCINNLTFFGVSFFPPGQQSIRDLEVRLVCPDGTSILLVPSGVTSSPNALQGYNQTCFVPSGGANIGSASSPYTGQFAPNQPLSNLNGCTANGVWAIELRSTSTLGFGAGTFFGWSITFDDPEISYLADFTWSPTTNMTGSNTLTPQVCPTATTTYTLTASDTAGCVTVTDQVTVTVQPSCCNLLFTGTHIDPSCGASNGSININVTQGTGPYTYAWSDGPATTANRTNLPAGTYTVSITDNGQPNCVKDTTITLVSPNSPVINSITPTAETCDGDNDGSISVNASGGTGTLTYTWTPANTGANINNLPDGNYTVTVTDANGCTATGNTTVAAGPPCCVLAISVAATNPSCGGFDGSITIAVTTGSGNYTYAWSVGSNSTNTLANIGAGTYTVTVTDVTQGCDIDTTITLSTILGPSASTVTTDETCLGAADGTATVTASGGTPPYTYSWNTTPVQTTAAAVNLPAGCYSVAITDAAGCTAFDQVCIAAGPNCCNLSFDISTSDPTCGNTDGSITITNLGGSGNYGFLWSDASTGQDLLNVGAGSYSVTITDNGFPNCQLDTTVTLSNPNAPTIDNIVATAETCLGANDGSIDLTITCGTTPCVTGWSNGASTEDISGLAPGTYTVTVTDALGCQTTGFIAVPAGPSCCNLAFDLDIVDPSCGQSNGSIEVTNITGASAQITFAWSNSLNTQIISGLAAGTYTVTVTDNGQPNCQLDSTITISDAGGATLVATATNETCAGAADGTANVVATGGAAPLTYTWSNTATGSSITGLAPGNYTVSVEDANGCVSTAQVTVIAGGQCCSLTASAATTPASCGTADGTITVTVDASSGVAPFEYNLNGGAFGASNTFTVAGGNYSVIARDANGCDTTLLVTVTEANNTIILSVSSSDPTCPGATDGWVGVNVAGGTPPNITTWSTGATTDTVLNLGAGTYSLTVTDQTNCSAFAQVTLTDPPPTSVNLGPDVDLCFGESVNLDAGLAGSYIWSTGDTTQSITAVVSGTYAVTITNAGGCTASDDIEVSVTAPFTVDAGEDTTIIQYESVLELNATVTGSAGGSYLWTPSDYLACDDCATTLLSPDSTTTYVLTYTDALGCIASDSVTITVLPGEYFAIVPNAFSPNGDGANDILYVYYKGVRRLVFRIHNRWGEKVFETDDMTQGWDGTFKGVPAQDGVYVWDLYAEFYNLKLPIQRSKGSVLLLK